MSGDYMLPTGASTWKVVINDEDSVDILHRRLGVDVGFISIPRDVWGWMIGLIPRPPTASEFTIHDMLHSAVRPEDDVDRISDFEPAGWSAEGEIHLFAEDLGKRAAKLLQSMLADCAQHLTGTSFGELNEVLYEARQRGWIEP